MRSEIDRQISDYLRQGGEVSQIDRGVSGRSDSSEPLRPQPFVASGSKAERTYLNHVVAALDERRRRQSRTQAKPGKVISKPRKEMVYDDFGEPLRWRWIDD